MDIAQIRYFLSVAEKLNYTQAAEDNLISRQGMRKALKALEVEVGVPLVENTRNHLALTETGAALAAAMKPVIDQFDKAEASIKAFARSNSTARLCYSSTIYPFLFPTFQSELEALCAANPHIAFDAAALPVPSVPLAIESGEFDCGLFMSVPPHEYENLSVTELAHFDLAVIVDANNPMAHKETVSVAELKDVPLVGFDDPNVSMKPFAHAAREAGVSFQSKTIPDVISALHETKNGCAFLTMDLENAVPLGIDAATVRIKGFSFSLLFAINENTPKLLACELLREHLLKLHEGN